MVSKIRKFKMPVPKYREGSPGISDTLRNNRINHSGNFQSVARGIGE